MGIRDFFKANKRNKEDIIKEGTKKDMEADLLKDIEGDLSAFSKVVVNEVVQGKVVKRKEEKKPVKKVKLTEEPIETRIKILKMLKKDVDKLKD